MEDNEIPIQFDNYQSYGPPPSSNFGTGSTQGQAWYPPPAENEKVPAFDIATGLRLVNDPYLFTNGMQNQGQKYIQSLQPYFNVKKKLCPEQTEDIVIAIFAQCMAPKAKL